MQFFLYIVLIQSENNFRTLMYRVGNDFDKLVNFIYESCTRRPLYFSNNSFVDKGLRQIYGSFLFFLNIIYFS